MDVSISVINKLQHYLADHQENWHICIFSYRKFICYPLYILIGIVFLYLKLKIMLYVASFFKTLLTQ